MYKLKKDLSNMIRKDIILSVALLAFVGVIALGTQTLAKAMDGGQAGMSQAQIEVVTAKKAEIQLRLTALKEARTTKLETKRLEICQQRQAKINEIVTHGVEQNTKQLAVFQKIEANVKQFYIDKKLSSVDYDATLAAADDAEAAAVAAIDAASTTTFDCTTTDSTNPGSVIKEAMTTRHSTLAAYRTAIKNLILVVKKANGEQKATTTPTDGVKEQ